MGTAERRLAIMKQLCRVRHVTMASLAEQYNVSIRTIQRDIFELTFLMPLDIKSGRYEGGVYVIGDYTMDRMYMTEEELDLLLKVKKMVKEELSEQENRLFDLLIQTYTKPAKKSA